MPPKRRSKMKALPPSFLGLHYALLDASINAYGAVKTINTDQDGNLKIHIVDARSELNVCVKKECIDLFEQLEVGDVLRCYKLEKEVHMGLFTGRNDMQCVAWSSATEDFTPKFATSENDVPFDANTIEQLRILGTGYRQQLEFKKMFEEYRDLLVLAQICSMPKPPLPEMLVQYDCVFINIRSNSVVTVQTLSEIPAITSHFVNDVYFNAFAKVLGVFSAQNSYVIQAWDCSYSQEFGQLATIESLGIQQELVPFRYPSTHEHFVVNIVLYNQSKWKDVVTQLKADDVVLFTNLHVSRRPLGDLVLTMHEGQEDKRFIVKVPEGHKAEQLVRQACTKRLQRISSLSAGEANNNSVQTCVSPVTSKSSVDENNMDVIEEEPEPNLLKAPYPTRAARRRRTEPLSPTNLPAPPQFRQRSLASSTEAASMALVYTEAVLAAFYPTEPSETASLYTGAAAFTDAADTAEAQAFTEKADVNPDSAESAATASLFMEADNAAVYMQTPHTAAVFANPNDSVSIFTEGANAVPVFLGVAEARVSTEDAPPIAEETAPVFAESVDMASAFMEVDDTPQASTEPAHTAPILVEAADSDPLFTEKANAVDLPLKAVSVPVSTKNAVTAPASMKTADMVPVSSEAAATVPVITEAMDTTPVSAEAANKAPACTEGVVTALTIEKRTEFKIELVQPTPEFLAAAEYFKDCKMPFLPILKRKQEEKKIGPILKKTFRPNYLFWRALIYNKMAHVWLTQCSKCKKIVEEEESDKQTQKCCKDVSLQSHFYLLVPLKDNSDLLVQLAIRPDDLRQLVPSIESLAKERCDAETKKTQSPTSWMTDIREELKKNNLNNAQDITLDLDVYMRFEDGCILTISSEETL